MPARSHLRSNARHACACSRGGRKCLHQSERHQLDEFHQSLADSNTCVTCGNAINLFLFALLQGQESRCYRQSNVGAFFRVELTSVSNAIANHCRYTVAVVATFRQAVRLAFGYCAIAVIKINVAVILTGLEDCALPINASWRLEPAPSVVRNFVLLSLRLGFWDCRDPTRKQSEAVMVTEFLAIFQHHLHANTYTQKWPIGVQELLDRADQITAAQFRHTIAESANPRQNDTTGFGYAAWRASQLDRAATMFEAFTYTPEVADAVIDNKDILAQSATWVPDSCKLSSGGARRTGIPAAVAACRQSASDKRR